MRSLTLIILLLHRTATNNAETSAAATKTAIAGLLVVGSAGGVYLVCIGGRVAGARVGFTKAVWQRWPV